VVFETEREIMSRMRSKVRAGAIPESYLALVKRHPLSSIRSENDLVAAQAVIDDLLRDKLDVGTQAYLDALSDLVILYEHEHHALAPLPAHELLAQMLEDRGTTSQALTFVRGILSSAVSDRHFAHLYEFTRVGVG
jgi:antitoxin component HigA of HigAB toxin-antitoxin module